MPLLTREQRQTMRHIDDCRCPNCGKAEYCWDGLQLGSFPLECTGCGVAMGVATETYDRHWETNIPVFGVFPGPARDLRGRFIRKVTRWMGSPFSAPQSLRPV